MNSSLQTQPIVEGIRHSQDLSVRVSTAAQNHVIEFSESAEMLRFEGDAPISIRFRKKDLPCTVLFIVVLDENIFSQSLIEWQCDLNQSIKFRFFSVQQEIITDRLIRPVKLFPQRTYFQLPGFLCQTVVPERDLHAVRKTHPAVFAVHRGGHGLN